MAPSPVVPYPMLNYDWDIEQRTKYWSQQPATKFNLRARPKETYHEYIDQVDIR